MDFLRRFPATIFLITANTLIFLVCYSLAGTFSEPAWSQVLVSMGAEFNPFTLGGEWYRIFTHQFLHGHILHLGFNMYALYSVGSVLEEEVGTTKFLWVYFLSGIAAALASLYWNVLIVGVGASGAIFGLFGFSVALNLFHSHKQGQSLAPILINLGVFLGINLLMAKAMRADNAAHIGGLVAGAVIAGISLLLPSYRQVRFEYLFLPLLIAAFFLLPRYQVSYYHFFEKVFATEDSSKLLFADKNLSDDEFVKGFKKENAGWDSAVKALGNIPYLPQVLHMDTFKLRHYIYWRKKENEYRMTMVDRESYIYMDSIEYAGGMIQPYLALEHIPPRWGHGIATPPPPEEVALPPAQVWYNENWEELANGPGKFYRIGSRDSMKRWQGKIKDHYANGDVQMKGAYLNDKRDGIFIYYSDHHTYQSAGRYRDDHRIGKWENFHDDGRMESEEYFRDGYFLKNYWDSTGRQQVKDGVGRLVKRYNNGVIAEEGSYRNGRQQDLWVGRHPDGQLYYEEFYIDGRLTRGRSQNNEHKNFIYDESTYYPTPEGGRKIMDAYLGAEASKVLTKKTGRVRLSFRVTKSGVITDIKIEKGLSPELDLKAREILLKGPRWIPAHEHGFIAIDGFGAIAIEFGMNQPQD